MCAVLRCALGLLMLVVVKELVKLVTKQALLQLCHLLSIPSAYCKRVSQVTYLKVHYSKHFITLNKVWGRVCAVGCVPYKGMSVLVSHDCEPNYMGLITATPLSCLVLIPRCLNHTPSL